MWVCHLKWQLDQRIGEPLAVGPLLAEDDVDAEHDEHEYEDEARPDGNGDEPRYHVRGGVERRRLSSRGGHVARERVGILEDEPIRVVMPEEVPPVVFSRREAEWCCEGRRQYLHLRVSGDRTGDAEHDVDGH